MNKFYEIGLMPNDNADDAYSLYVKTEDKLKGSTPEKVQYLVENNLIPDSKAKDVIYIQPCTEKEYEWSIN